MAALNNLKRDPLEIQHPKFENSRFQYDVSFLELLKNSKSIIFVTEAYYFYLLFQVYYETPADLTLTPSIWPEVCATPVEFYFL